MTHHVREYLQKMPFRDFAVSPVSTKTKAPVMKTFLKSRSPSCATARLIFENRNKAAKVNVVLRSEDRHGGMDGKNSCCVFTWQLVRKTRRSIIWSWILLSEVSLPQLLRFAGLKRREILEMEVLVYGSNPCWSSSSVSLIFMIDATQKKKKSQCLWC